MQNANGMEAGDKADAASDTGVYETGTCLLRRDGHSCVSKQIRAKRVARERRKPQATSDRKKRPAIAGLFGSIVSSVVDLTFASVSLRVLEANVKSKTTLES